MAGEVQGQSAVPSFSAGRGPSVLAACLIAHSYNRQPLCTQQACKHRAPRPGHAQTAAVGANV